MRSLQFADAVAIVPQFNSLIKMRSPSSTVSTDYWVMDSE